MEKVRTATQVVDLEQMNKRDIRLAAELITAGEALPIMFGEVYALVADARNPIAENLVRKIKNRPRTKPFGLLADAKTTAELVDLDRVHPAYHGIFEPRVIERLFGDKGFLRFPVLANEANLLAPGVFDENKMTIQTFTFIGNKKAYKLESALRNALQRANGGRGEILVTSFNISGEESIINHDAAIGLAVQASLRLLVTRRKSKGRGSYSIYEVGQIMEKIREGTGSEEIDVEFGLG